MSQKPCAWRVAAKGSVERLPEITPELEKYLEDWIEQDPTIVDSDLLIIGRQVETDYGTLIDLLGLDSEGNLVVIELKRQKTLRETVAQALEYAAWAARLGYEEIVQCATKKHFRGEQELQEAFRSRFDQNLPETLNQAQRILLVAPAISEGTHAVIEYLSETYGLPINGVSFGLFDVAGQPLLVRQVTLPEETASNVRPAGTKKRFPSTAQLLEQAEANGVGEIARTLMSTLQPMFRPAWRGGGGCWQFGRRTEGEKQQYLPAMTIFPTAMTKPGAVVIAMKPENLQALYSKNAEQCQAFIQRMQTGVGTPESKVSPGYDRFSLRTKDQAEAFVREFQDFAGPNGSPEA